jgi:hypothetical protein
MAKGKSNLGLWGETVAGLQWSPTDTDTDALNTELERIQGEGGGAGSSVAEGAAAPAEVHRFFATSPVSILLEGDEEAIHETPATPPPPVADIELNVVLAPFAPGPPLNPAVTNPAPPAPIVTA